MPDPGDQLSQTMENYFGMDTADGRRRTKYVAIASAVILSLCGIALAVSAVIHDPVSGGRNLSSSGCDRSNPNFDSHRPGMEPAGSGAQAVRAGGYLVSSDGAGGSCVFVSG